MRHGGWKSSTVAEGYVEQSVGNKKRIANQILGHRASDMSVDGDPPVIPNNTLRTNQDVAPMNNMPPPRLAAPIRMSVSDVPDQTDYSSNDDSLVPMTNQPTDYTSLNPGPNVASSSVSSFIAPSVNTTGNNIMMPQGTGNGLGASNGFQFNPMQFSNLTNCTFNFNSK